MKQRTEIKNVKQFERELKEAKAKELEVHYLLIFPTFCDV